jgi:uncharacterized protein YkwD
MESRGVFGSLFVVMTTAAIAFAGPAKADVALTPFEIKLLETHNVEREKAGAPALVWDKSLAVSAARWAETLARKGTFEHDAQDKHGENLWMGTHTAYQPEEMVGGWVAERKDFKPGVFPHVSKTRNWADVGHYTQLIWKTTTHVGCAKASAQDNDYLVCRYSPPGNWEGVALTNDSRPVKGVGHASMRR